MLPRSVSQVLSEWSRDGSSCPCPDLYHFKFCLPHALYLHRTVFIFQSPFWVTFPALKLQHLLTHVPFSLSRIMMSGLLLGMVLSVCTFWILNVVTLTSWLFSTAFGSVLLLIFVSLSYALCFLSFSIFDYSGTFAKWQRAAVSSAMSVSSSVCPPARNNSAPTGRVFHEISYLSIFPKPIGQIQV